MTTLVVKLGSSIVADDRGEVQVDVDQLVAHSQEAGRAGGGDDDGRPIELAQARQ